MNNNVLGARLKERRLQKGLRQIDVAAEVSCAPTALSNYENGIIDPPFGVLSELCEVLEISALDLLEKKYDFDDILKILKKPVDEWSYEEQVAMNFSHHTVAAIYQLEKERENPENISSKTGFSLTDLDLLGSNNENKVSPITLALFYKVLSCEQGINGLARLAMGLQDIELSMAVDDAQI